MLLHLWGTCRYTQRGMLYQRVSMDSAEGFGKNAQVLRSIIVANCIDCVIVQGAFIHVPRFRAAVEGITCKVIFAHHFEPQWELVFGRFGKVIRYHPNLWWTLPDGQKYNNVSFDGNAEETATFLSLPCSLWVRWPCGAALSGFHQTLWRICRCAWHIEICSYPQRTVIRRYALLWRTY